jgi:protein TonB
LKFNYFIIASVLVHLLFIGIMSITHSNTEKKETVFDVKIIAPLETEKAFVPKKKNIQKKRRIPDKTIRKQLPLFANKPRRRPPEKKRYAVIRKRPEPPDKDLKPETVFGDGLGRPQKGLKDSERAEGSVKPEGRDSREAAKETLPLDKDGKIPSGKSDSSLSPRAFLFDKKTIEKYASKGPVGVHDGKGLMFYAPEFKNRAYMRMLRDRIESIWKYPKKAASRRLTGDLYIKFSIRKNGKLDKIELVRTSGYRELDEAAMQALKKGEPYWPLPENYDKEVLEITGHFVYVLGATL